MGGSLNMATGSRQMTPLPGKSHRGHIPVVRSGEVEAAAPDMVEGLYGGMHKKGM